MKELLEWSSRKDQPEIIKQMTTGMSENMKKLEGHLKYIKETGTMSNTNVEGAIIELAEKLA